MSEIRCPCGHVVGQRIQGREGPMMRFRVPNRYMVVGSSGRAQVRCEECGAWVELPLELTATLTSRLATA